MNRILIIILSCNVFLNCNKKSINLNTKKEINTYLNSSDKDSILIGIYNVRKQKDTSFIPLIFRHITDRRVSHHESFYGTSVTKACIVALKEISGINPPNEISYKFDSINVVFYRQIFPKKQ
jgi:hypothetical protein